MPTFVTANSKEFTPAPEGTHRAVCVDCIDVGEKATPWGAKRKVDIKWQIDEPMENGKRFLVQKRYTASLNEKATLRHDLEAWRGRAFTDAELAKFDLDALIGANCIVSIVHRKVDKGGTFANVATVSPLMKGMPKMEAMDYVREKDRKPEVSAAEAPGEDTREDDEPPF